MKNGNLTEKILGSCFEVMNELGAGFLESVYIKASGLSVGLLVNFGQHQLEYNRLYG